MTTMYGTTPDNYLGDSVLSVRVYCRLVSSFLVWARCGSLVLSPRRRGIWGLRSLWYWAQYFIRLYGGWRSESWDIYDTMPVWEICLRNKNVLVRYAYIHINWVLTHKWGVDGYISSNPQPCRSKPSRVFLTFTTGVNFRRFLDSPIEALSSSSDFATNLINVRLLKSFCWQPVRSMPWGLANRQMISLLLLSERLSDLEPWKAFIIAPIRFRDVLLLQASNDTI